MSNPTLTRKLRLFERPWPWMAVSAGGTCAFVVLAVLATSGALDGFGRELRGYTSSGVILGSSAVALTLFALFYSLRKRSLQERLPFGRATMMTWLWLHVAVGALALVAATLHGGYGVISTHFSTGKLVFLVFALLALTGVAWRIVYSAVPKVAAPKIGNYSKSGSEKRAEEQLTEIEKLAAGRSDSLRRLKDWLVETERSGADIAQPTMQLPEEERGLVAELDVLAKSLSRARRRQALQTKYTRILQGFRVIHIPLTILFVPLLALHVVAALELPAKLSNIGGVPIGDLSGFHPSKNCASCHRAHFEQWRNSMHAHAMTSPVTVAQHAQLQAGEYAGLPSPDPKKICINCHGPIGTALTSDVSLPLSRPFYDDDLLNEGVGCATCHQIRGEPPGPGAMGLSASLSIYEPGSTFFGPIADPVGNAYHKSEQTPVFEDGERLCVGCHDVTYDTNSDGKIVKGQDLVLQQLIEEYGRYQKAGGSGTCLGCHMPLVDQLTRAADGASIPFEQDESAPPRAVHDHSFVGVDYPIDEVATNDPQKKAREQLLRSAASLSIEGGSITGGKLTFKARLKNGGSGHNLPTGFAFARQVWLEVIVTDGSGNELLSSGVVEKAGDDLCDASTMDDPGNPVAKHVKGCTKSDPFLVNLQQKLVSKFQIVEDEKTGEKLLDDVGDFKQEQAEKGVETMLQRVRAGVVPRTRPFDKTKMVPLQPLEERRFGYTIPFPGPATRATVTVRLLFRSLAPCLLRELADGDTNDKSLGDLTQNLQIVEMATAEVRLTAQ